MGYPAVTSSAPRWRIEPGELVYGDSERLNCPFWPSWELVAIVLRWWVGSGCSRASTGDVTEFETAGPPLDDVLVVLVLLDHEIGSLQFELVALPVQPSLVLLVHLELCGSVGP